MNPPPICENCRRVVHRTLTVALVIEGAYTMQRELCSACRVHVMDCFPQTAPWIEAPPRTRARAGQ